MLVCVCVFVDHFQSAEYLLALGSAVLTCGSAALKCLSDKQFS